MEEKDLKQIKELLDSSFDEKLPKAFGDFWEGNLEPAFDAVYERLMKLKTICRL